MKMKEVYEAIVDDLTGSFEDAELFMAFCEEMKNKSYGAEEIPVAGDTPRTGF